MSQTLALVGDVIGSHGFVVLAAGDDLSPTNATDPNLNLTLWASIAGVIAPFLVALVNQPQWPPFARAIMTLLVSVGLGAATAAVEGRLTGTRWTTAALIVAAAAVASYKTLWRQPAAALEAATSGQSVPARTGAAGGS
jgi:peptidoglycan/LPS O-acetylase OafA/YrhL